MTITRKSVKHANYRCPCPVIVIPISSGNVPKMSDSVGSLKDSNGIL